MKKLVSIILCLAMLLSLCACGSKDEPKTHEVDIGGYSVEITSVDYILSEYLSKDETIWYQLDEDKGKASDVKKIFVINPDGTLYYVDKVSYTLGELEQMEDADIAAMVKNEYRQSVITGALGVDPDNKNATYEYLYHVLFWERLGDIVNNPDADIYAYLANRPGLAAAVEDEKDCIDAVYAVFRNLAEDIQNSEYGSDMAYILDEALYSIINFASVEEVCEVLKNEYADLSGVEYVLSKLEESYSLMPVAIEAVYSNILSQVETMSGNVQPTQYKMAITTDSTGNHTASMLFAYQLISTPSGTRFDDFNLYYQYPITTSEGITTNCTTVVYDSIYGGFSDDGDLFYTRINTNAHFMLDQIGECDLPIDVKDIKTLFE